MVMLSYVVDNHALYVTYFLTNELSLQSFRGRTQFPIGIPTIGKIQTKFFLKCEILSKKTVGFNYGIPAVDEPGTSYVGLSSDLQPGVEYAGVANLFPPGDPEDESANVVMAFSYARKSFISQINIASKLQYDTCQMSF